MDFTISLQPRCHSLLPDKSASKPRTVTVAPVARLLAASRALYYEHWPPSDDSGHTQWVTSDAAAADLRKFVLAPREAGTEIIFHS